jgi:hypothetical protein
MSASLIKTDPMRGSIVKLGTTSSNYSTAREQLAQTGARSWGAGLLARKQNANFASENA